MDASVCNYGWGIIAYQQGYLFSITKSEFVARVNCRVLFILGRVWQAHKIWSNSTLSTCYCILLELNPSILIHARTIHKLIKFVFHCQHQHYIHYWGMCHHATSENVLIFSTTSRRPLTHGTSSKRFESARPPQLRRLWMATVICILLPYKRLGQYKWCHYHFHIADVEPINSRLAKSNLAAKLSLSKQQY